MKILITTHFSKDYGGSELFTLNLAKELKNSGHEITVFTLIPGKVSDEIEKLGIGVATEAEVLKNKNFDIIHVQHNSTAAMVSRYFPNVPRIYMCHGTVPRLEQPPGMVFDKYFAVSESTRNHLIKKHKIEGKNVVIVRNWIDMEKFSEKKSVRQKPEKLLVINNHFFGKNRKIIADACRKSGIDFEHIGMPDRPVRDVENYINEADIVISVGRGALEAMACGRNVIPFDISGGEEMVTEENFMQLVKYNFSGKCQKVRYGSERLVQELKKYDPRRGKKLRDLVMRENNKDNIIRFILEQYQKCIEAGGKCRKEKKPFRFWFGFQFYWYLREKYHTKLKIWINSIAL